MDEKLLRLVAEANQIEFQHLHRHLGEPISEFYSNFVCGGVLLTLKNGTSTNTHIDAPLAFQSVMSGILVASEFYIWKTGNMKKDYLTSTHLYPLHPLNNEINPYSHELTKDSSGRCICADQDYLNAYHLKWKK